MKETTSRQSAAAAFLVMFCTLGSRILGFARTALLGALFGAGGTADVLTAVFNIPNNFRKLLAEGALSTAFIPELSGKIAHNPQGPESRLLARQILALQLLIVVPLLLFTQAFPQWVLPLFVRFSDPVKEAQSLIFLRGMSPYLLLVCVSAVIMAVLNSHNYFLMPALTPLLFSLGVMAFLIFGAERWGGMAMAWGVLAGGMAQILFVTPLYRRLNYSLVPLFRFKTPSFRRVQRRWIPVLLTSSLFTVNHQIAMLLASTLADKSTSVLFYAIVFWQLPFGLFSSSINTVLYPKMSRQAARKDKEGLAASISFGCRSLWGLLLPSAAIYLLLGAPLIAAAFQRGAFTREDTLLTARVLTAYTWGMPFVGLFNFSQRGLYAQGSTKAPFLAALVTVALDIGFSLLFIFGWKKGVDSLAWANSLAFFLGALLQLTLLKKRSSFRIRGSGFQEMLKVLFITLFAAGVLKGLLLLLGEGWWQGGSSWKAVGILAALGLGIFGLIGLLYTWMGVEVVSIIKRKPQGAARKIRDKK